MGKCNCNKKPNCGCAGGFTGPVISIDNPEKIIMFRKVVIPASLGDEIENPVTIGKYCNVLMVYEANGHAYLYSSDGIPTRIAFDSGGILVVDEIPPAEKASVGFLYITYRGKAAITMDNVNWIKVSNGDIHGTDNFNELINRPKVDGEMMTGDTDIPLSNMTDGIAELRAGLDTERSEREAADDSFSSSLSSETRSRMAADSDLSSRITSLNSTVETKLDKVVMTDLSLNSNASTTTVELKGDKENLWTNATSTKNIPLPVASATQAGVMNSATFNAVAQNTEDIEAIMNGAVAIDNLAANVTQAQLTAAWKTATGQTDLINHASVYDIANNKIWTYYDNTATWYAASNTTQVDINTFTNTAEGTIKGSTNVGQVFAESDGTGSVNGWDALTAQVDTNTTNITSLQTDMGTKQDKLIAGNAIRISDDNTISATVYPEDFFTAEATKEIEDDIVNMSGTANLQVKHIDIRGNTYQNKYEGVNYLRSPFNLRRDNIQSDFETSQSYVGRVGIGKADTRADGTLQKLFLYEKNNEDYIITLPAGTYRLYYGGGRGVPEIVIKAGSQEYHATEQTNYKVEIQNTIVVDEMYIEIPLGYTGYVSDYFYPAIIPENVTIYEPYVGLKKSPSPQFPQRLFNATGDQIIKAANANLYNYADIYEKSNTASSDEDGWITFDPTGNNRYSNYWTHPISLSPDTEYSLIVEVGQVTNKNAFISINLANNTYNSQIEEGASLPLSSFVTGSVHVYRIKTKKDLSASVVSLRTFANCVIGEAGSVSIRITVSPDLTMTPSKFIYQKYLGQDTIINLGVNLFDKNSATYNVGRYFTTGGAIITGNDRDMVLYLPCSPYTEYSLSNQENIGVWLRRISTTSEFPDIGVKTQLAFTQSSLKQTYFDTTTGAKYIVIRYQADEGKTIQDILPDILNTLQIERTQRQIGFYSPYFTPIELHKLGDSQDRIFRDGLTDWILHKETKKIIYDGSEADWVVDDANNTATIPHGGGIIPTDYLCTHFRADENLSEDNTFSIDGTNITFKSTDVITSLQDWKDWLALNPISVLVRLETPVETEITNPQVLDGLVKMRNIICYPDFTIFAADGSESANANLRIEAYLNSLQGLSAAIRDIPICC